MTSVRARGLVVATGMGTAIGRIAELLQDDVLALMRLAHALAVRSERESTFRLGMASNVPLFLTIVGTALVQLALVYVPLLQPIFETQALGVAELFVVLLAAPVPFVAVEIEKWFLRRREGHPKPLQVGAGSGSGS